LTIDKGHGRIEERRIWVSDELNGYIEFPYARQVFKVERVRKEIRGGVIKKEETEVVYGVSSLSKDKAGAERLLELNRGHWEIENRLFWVRDVTFDEDRSRVRKKNGTEIMSSLRNLAISLIRIKRDFRYIPSALRHFSMHIDKAMMLLGI